MTPATSLPPDVLLALAIVFGVVALVVAGGLIAVALRPTQISADHGSKVDYSPRAKVEVTRPQRGEERPEDGAP